MFFVSAARASCTSSLAAWALAPSPPRAALPAWLCCSLVFGCILGDPSSPWYRPYIFNVGISLRELTIRFSLDERTPNKVIDVYAVWSLGTFNSMPTRSAPQTSDWAVHCAEQLPWRRAWKRPRPVDLTVLVTDHSTHVSRMMNVEDYYTDAVTRLCDQVMSQKHP